MPLPPGPPLPPLAQTLAWAATPEALMRACRARYGDRFTIRLAGVGRFVFLSGPGDLKRVFTADPERVRAGESNLLLEPILGPRSVLLLDGAEHLRARRLLLPPFHGDRLARWRDLIAEIADERIDRWRPGAELRLQDEMQAITLDAILRVVFGIEAGERLESVRRRVLRLLAIAARPIAVVPFLRRDLGPRSPFGRFLAAREQLDRALYDEIARRRRDPRLDERDDVLSLLLGARDEAGEPMTDRELRDQLVTLLLAGHETTATGLAWAFDRLLHAPAALANAIDDARAGAEPGGYVDAVVEETLRLHPPVPLVGRLLREPLELDGLALPAGVRAAPCIWLVHRRPDLYPDPDAFRPERFLDGSPDTYSWLPFGGGLRRCVGAAFATLEMRVVGGRVLARTGLRAVAPRGEGARRRAIVLAPARGARATVERVDGRRRLAPQPST